MDGSGIKLTKFGLTVGLLSENDNPTPLPSGCSFTPAVTWPDSVAWTYVHIVNDELAVDEVHTIAFDAYSHDLDLATYPSTLSYTAELVNSDSLPGFIVFSDDTRSFTISPIAASDEGTYNTRKQSLEKKAFGTTQFMFKRGFAIL